MKNTGLKSLGKTSIALIASALLGPTGASAAGREEALSAAGLWWVTDPIEGLWNVEVTLTNCTTGDPIPTVQPFPAMALFARGGTFHDTNGNALSPPSTRSAGFGVWNHVRGRTYEFAFKLFRFDNAAQPLGSQVVRHTVTLARDGNSYTSSGTSQAFDPAGTPLSGPPTGCSKSTATRFE
jgi:hypothetical protein